MCSSTCLLPVLVEEEESVQDGAAEVSTVAAGMEGRKKTCQICVHGEERKREPDFSKRTVCLRLLTSERNFDHPHTNSPFQGQTSSSAAERPPFLTAALLSHGHPQHMAANQGAAWAV